MKKMTKKEAIKKYLNDMSDVDLINLVRDINSYSNEYEPWAFIPMDEFDSYYACASPTQIAKDVQNGGDDFSIDDDYFYYDSWGILSSSNEADAADSIRHEILDNLTNDFYRGSFLDVIFDDCLKIIILSDDDSLFNSDYSC